MSGRSVVIRYMDLSQSSRSTWPWRARREHEMITGTILVVGLLLVSATLGYQVPRRLEQWRNAQ
jgi:hypothetical protein